MRIFAIIFNNAFFCKQKQTTCTVQDARNYSKQGVNISKTIQVFRTEYSTIILPLHMYMTHIIHFKF